MGTWTRYLGALAAGLGLSGCVAELGTSAEGEPTEPVADVEEALSSCDCNNSTYVSTNVANSVFTGPTRSGNICWPTRYDRRSGTSPNFTVEDDEDGLWRFTGSGEATCLPRCCFKSNTPGATRTLSSQFDVSASNNSTLAFEIDVEPLVGGAMQFLTGIKHDTITGPFTAQHAGMYDEDRAEVTLDPNPDLSAVASVDGCGVFPVLCPTSRVNAVAFSLLVGVPVLGGVHNVKKTSRTLTPSIPTARDILPMSQGACTVSSLVGAQGSSGAAVTLIRDTVSGKWQAQLGSNVSSAVITCYRFDQTD